MIATLWPAPTVPLFVMSFDWAIGTASAWRNVSQLLLHAFFGESKGHFFPPKLERRAVQYVEPAMSYRCHNTLHTFLTNMIASCLQDINVFTSLSGFRELTCGNECWIRGYFVHMWHSPWITIYSKLNSYNRKMCISGRSLIIELLDAWICVTRNITLIQKPCHNTRAHWILIQLL